MTQFSLTWNTFRNNICDGLSSFQEKEEFVDMTLAADGHFVKVHQMIISLASPYLKELIKSAPCPHPVLFLNQVSYPILSSILEYIYSGEVVINKEDIGELIQAGKALHIRGLEEMDDTNVQVMGTSVDPVIQNNAIDVKIHSTAGSLVKKRKNDNNDYLTTPQGVKIKKTLSSQGVRKSMFTAESDVEISYHDDASEDIFHDGLDDSQYETGEGKSTTVATDEAMKPTVQYTLSTQGHIQMILNRYMYGLTYQYKNSNARLWKCVEVKKNKCPASVTTKDDVVVSRVGAHKHPFHDKKILKKVQAGLVLTAIREAETKGKEMRDNNES